MENASKALIMAGSILIALLVAGMVSMVYSQMSKVEQTKIDVEKNKKVVDYAKTFEQYNKNNIYGSEILSLANLQEDYNFRQAEMKGYTNINVTVQIIRPIYENGIHYINTGKLNIQTIKVGIEKMISDIENFEKNNNGYKNKKENNKRSVSYYAQLSNRQIATLFDISYSSSENDYDIGERLANYAISPTTYKLLQDIEKYKNLKTSYAEFKNTSFKCDNTVYDGVGRLTSMHFVER